MLDVSIPEDRMSKRHGDTRVAVQRVSYGHSIVIFSTRNVTAKQFLVEDRS